MERRLLPHSAVRRSAKAAGPSDELVVVANRLPLQVGRDGTLVRSPGGLVSALSSVDDDNMRWIGWLGCADEESESPDLTESRMHPISLSSHEVEGFYDGFCNSLLWPLFHGRVQRIEINRAWWRTYRAINQRFAMTAARVAAPNSTVWIHDYHLLLAPAMLRARRRDLRIGTFLHIPFPPAQLFATLPWRREILHGMLGADLMGFQTDDDVDNVAASIDRLLRGNRSRRERSGGFEAHAFAISIDFDHWSTLGDRAAADAEARRQRLDADIVYVGADRLDYTKGIAQRLRAFGELLDERHLDPARTTFVQIAVPSRSDLLTYQEERDEIERVVREVNARHPRSDGPGPIEFVDRQLDEAELCEWYRAADCLVVTSLADGMNLVAKEFVACRADRRGVVVLSEFAGAANDLPGAILVNPYDIDAIKTAMCAAASMPPEEQLDRMVTMREQVREHDLEAWARSYLGTLRTLTTRPSTRRATRPSEQRDRREIVR